MLSRRRSELERIEAVLRNRFIAVLLGGQRNYPPGSV